MRRAPAALCLAAAWLLAAPATTAAALADRGGATFTLMASQFVEAFQPVEGLVVGVDGDLVYVDIGEGRGARVGQELVVYRKGAEFHHPLTGKPLGRYEDVLGWAQIRRVQARFSEARFVPVQGQPRPQAEDGVRITRGRIKVAITPVLDLTRQKSDLRRVPFMLATVLERSRRFQVIDPLTVGDVFASGEARVEEVLALPERAVRVSRRFEVSGWIVPVLLERRGVTYLDVTWISAVSGTALFSHREALVPASSAEAQRFPWEPGVED